MNLFNGTESIRIEIQLIILCSLHHKIYWNYATRCFFRGFFLKVSKMVRWFFSEAGRQQLHRIDLNWNRVDFYCGYSIPPLFMIRLSRDSRGSFFKVFFTIIIIIGYPKINNCFDSSGIFKQTMDASLNRCKRARSMQTASFNSRKVELNLDL